MRRDKLDETLRDRVVELATDACVDILVLESGSSDAAKREELVANVIRDVYDKAFEEGFDWGYETGVENYEY